MKKLEFYVWNYDFNAKKVVPFNIFNNHNVYKSVEKETKEYLKNPKKYKYKDLECKKVYKGFKALKHNIDDIIKWQEWSRCEYEIYVSGIFDGDTPQKVDCYDIAHENIKWLTKMCILYFNHKDIENVMVHK